MSLLTRIVKSSAVVDSRSEGDERPPAASPPPVTAGGVLKRQVLEGDVSFRRVVPLPTKDTYTDELNRLRVEIKQAKEELKALGRDIDAARQADAEAANLRDAAGADLEEAEISAVQIIRDAEKRAKKLLETAAAEAAEAAEEARNNGYLEGFQKGFDEAGAEFEGEYAPKLALLEDALDRLSDLEREAVGRHRDNMVALALTAAGKIVGRKLAEEPGAVAELLRELVAENVREEYVKITLSPDLMPVQARAGEKVRALLMGLGANVTVVTDIQLPDESITVETPRGVVDVSIATQLNNLQKAATES